MKERELNLKLLASFPQIKENYKEETSWQDGDDTGSHIVYADVFVPFIKKQIITKNEVILKQVFDFIENLIELNDEYVMEVICLSVIETLIFDEETDITQVISLSKPRTLKVIEETLENLQV